MLCINPNHSQHLTAQLKCRQNMFTPPRVKDCHEQYVILSIPLPLKDEQNQQNLTVKHETKSEMTITCSSLPSPPSSSSLSVLSSSSVPKAGAKVRVTDLNKIRVADSGAVCSSSIKLGRNLTRVNAAGLSQIEPDLNEDPRDRWATNGIAPEDFIYGEYDGHHTYHESHDKGTFWGSIAEDYKAVEPPTGFQGIISWLFPPAIAAGMYFNAPGEYLYIGAALFTVVFCIIEMDKPDKPHNFEPQIYNMERGARDKLMADYNTMDIWDFNEKYGELWDFTVNNEDLVKY